MRMGISPAWCWSVVVLTAALCSGCRDGHGLNSVHGKVTRTDGSPLVKARVTFECDGPPVSATAMTDEQGEFQLGTYRVGDGAPAGRYRVALAEWRGDDADHPVPRTIDPKYERFDTSALVFTVEEGQNSFAIQLKPAD
jgi:hypothetical protein